MRRMPTRLVLATATLLALIWIPAGRAQQSPP